MIDRKEEENIEPTLPASTLRQKLVEGSLRNMSGLSQDSNALSFYEAWQNLLPRIAENQNQDQQQIQQQTL